MEITKVVNSPQCDLLHDIPSASAQSATTRLELSEREANIRSCLPILFTPRNRVQILICIRKEGIPHGLKVSRTVRKGTGKRCVGSSIRVTRVLQDYGCSDQVYGASTRHMLQEAGLGNGSRRIGPSLAASAQSHVGLPTKQAQPARWWQGDVNPDQLVVAKWHCAKCEHPAPISVQSRPAAYATGLPSGSFDIVAHAPSVVSSDRAGEGAR